VLYVQKGAVLIDHDHRPSTYVAASVIALSLLVTGATVRAETGPLQPATTVTLVENGNETVYPTRANTVSNFLKEEHVDVKTDDYLSASPDTILFDGMRVEHRSAVSIVLVVGNQRRVLLSPAQTVMELLATQEVALGPHDETVPALDARIGPAQVVQVTRVKVWTQKVVHTIPASVRHPGDPYLAKGTTLTIEEGVDGRREVSYRFVQRNNERPRRTVVGTRVLRKPRAKVVAVGTTPRENLAEFVVDQLAAIPRVNGKPVRMVATAYTKDCYGCMGITAYGLHPGHGVVAVDPQVIPLGTKLYVPGYGQAIAGDIGGDIKGRRIDLGFNSYSQAINFGRREITVYVLR
jgi:uncharacterized protein YabE (DUF348 family)